MRKDLRRDLFVDLQYSIRKALSQATGYTVKFMENGMESPLEDMPIMHLVEEEANYDLIAKLRESVNVRVDYKLEIYARDIMELKRMQGAVTNYILFESIPYIHVETGEVVGEIIAEPSFMAMEYLREVSRTTEYLRRQFFFNVSVVLHKH